MGSISQTHSGNKIKGQSLGFSTSSLCIEATVSQLCLIIKKLPANKKITLRHIQPPHLVTALANKLRANRLTKGRVTIATDSLLEENSSRSEHSTSSTRTTNGLFGKKSSQALTDQKSDGDKQVRNSLSQ
jgi:hypothetical protein